MRSLLFLMIIALPAAAQYQPGYSPNPAQLNYLPNYYNRATQPLSPYLNLMRGSNPAVNYYFGARPGLPTGGVNTFGQAPPYQPFVGMLGGGFLMHSSWPNDGSSPTYEPGGKPVVLRSASHPVLYGNQFLGQGSYASVYASSQGHGSALQPQPGQQQQKTSSTQGVGNSPPHK